MGKSSAPKLSVRNATMTMTLALVAATAAISLGLALSMADKAITDTQSTCDSGLETAIDSGLSNSEILAGELINTVNNVIMSKLRILFNAPMQTTFFLAQMALGNGVDGSTNQVWMADSLRPVLYNSMVSTSVAGVTTIQYVANEGPFLGGQIGWLAMQEDVTTVGDMVLANKQFWSVEGLNMASPPNPLDLVFGTPDKLGRIVEANWPNGCSDGTTKVLEWPPLGCKGNGSCYSGRCPIPHAGGRDSSADAGPQMGPESRELPQWYDGYQQNYIEGTAIPMRYRLTPGPKVKSGNHTGTIAPGRLLIATGWSPAQYKYDFASTGTYFRWCWTPETDMTKACGMFDFNQVAAGDITVEADVTGISTYCDTSALPPQSRIFILERNPWDVSGNVITRDGTVIGSTKQYGDAHLEIPDYGFEIPFPPYTFKHWHLRLLVNNHTDYYMRAAGSWLLSEGPRALGAPLVGQETLLDVLARSTNLTTRQIEAHTGSTTDDWWVKVSKLYDNSMSDRHPLTVFIVQMVKKSEAMRTINEQTAQTKSMIKKENKEVEDERQVNLVITVVVLVVIIILFMIAGILFTIAITKPLQVLAKEMALVATMELDGINEDSPLSMFRELHKMQNAFRAMVRNMRELRNFMPQSLLADTAGDVDEQSEIASLIASSCASPRTKRTDATGSCAASGSAASPRAAKKKKKGSEEGSASGSGKASGSGMNSSTQLSSHASARQRKAMEGFLQKMAGGDMKEKKITGVVINCIGSLGQFGGKNMEAAVEWHAAACADFLVVSAQFKGIMEAFNGDRFYTSFNAVKPVAGHRVAGCGMVTAAKRGKAGSPRANENDSKPSDVSASVCTGQAKCGLLGCPGMKKFSMMGSSMTENFALERLARDLNIWCALDKWVADDSSGNYMMRNLGPVALKKRLEKPFAVWELGNAKQAAEDEWMYQLEEAEKADPNASWNNAVVAAMAGQWGDAETALAKIPEDAPRIDWLRSTITDQKLTPIDLKYH